MALYDKIGIGYDTTRSADPYLLSRLIHHLRPVLNARYLDLGCGTANYTGAMHDAGVSIIGVDASAAMLTRARAKHRSITFLQARAERMPFQPGAFAGATCTFVHHHLDDPVAAFAELRRVLAADGRLVILNGTAEQLRHYWLCEYFPRATAKAIAPLARFETQTVLEAAGFRIEATELYEVRDDLRDYFLYCGKNRPELYLDPKVRAGISTFADAPDPTEIEIGVVRLRDDIASGRIAQVMRAYAWDGGDYMFTVAVR